MTRNVAIHVFTVSFIDHVASVLHHVEPLAAQNREI